VGTTSEAPERAKASSPALPAERRVGPRAVSQASNTDSRGQLRPFVHHWQYYASRALLTHRDFIKEKHASSYFLFHVEPTYLTAVIYTIRDDS
jgi:hypothetical protein